MATTVGFLADGSEVEMVSDWFERHPLAPVRVSRPDGHWFHFASLGALVHKEGQPVQEESPLVFVTYPRRLRGVFWTGGEVSFTASPLRRRFPQLHDAAKQFRKWLSQWERVFSWRRPSDCKWSHFLVGGLRNHDVDLFALPEAARALRQRQYFVRYDVSQRELDVLCSSLRLIGAQCESDLADGGS